MTMKVLLVDATADTSSKDFFNGYYSALKDLGCEVYVYAASARIDRTSRFLDFSYRQARRSDPDVERPTGADVVYWAGVWSLEMALRIRPDWVIVVAGMYIAKSTMTLLRLATWPHMKMALMVCDAPYDDNEIVDVLPLYDQVFVNEEASVPLYLQYNPNVAYLGACYDPVRHNPTLVVPSTTPSHDVVFVGTGFKERVELLSSVDWSGIDLGLYGNWQDLGSRSRLRRFVRGGPITNDLACGLYRRARIGLNMHRTRLSSPDVPLQPGSALSLNPRAIELAACGVFQISDYRKEASTLFGSSFVTFADSDELRMLVHRFLEDDEGRRKFASNALNRVRGRTYTANARVIIEMLGSRQAA